MGINDSKPSKNEERVRGRIDLKMGNGF